MKRVASALLIVALSAVAGVGVGLVVRLYDVAASWSAPESGAQGHFVRPVALRPHEHGLPLRPHER